LFVFWQGTNSAPKLRESAIHIAGAATAQQGMEQAGVKLGLVFYIGTFNIQLA
jgi:hypothetical protein